MLRRTLVDFFADLAAIDGEFIVFDDGYRSWSYTYGEIAAAARAFGDRLRAAGITSGQSVAIWGENRAEWVVAMWGCILEGVVLVPIDYRASADLLRRIIPIVDAKAVLVGDATEFESTDPPVWRLSALGPRRSALEPPVPSREPPRAPSAEPRAPTPPPRSSSRPAPPRIQKAW